MRKVKDFTWSSGMKVCDLVESMESLGYQSVELAEASNVILKMKRDGAKIFLTFTSNMVTSGLRGFFAQLCRFKFLDSIFTTSGAIEEDIMKSFGEEFEISSFKADDDSLHEKGENRIGNLVIKNSSYMVFEDKISDILEKIYNKNSRISGSDLLKEIGLFLDDENSFLYQAAKNNIPVYCPGISDSSFGFHLHMFQQKYKDFIVDSLWDIQKLNTRLDFDEKKALISLGGGISKHYAIFSALISGGFDYAVYLTTSHSSSGSISGATTSEAKSWGKLKDDAQAATVIGDVCITFPLIMVSVLDKMQEQGLLK